VLCPMVNFRPTASARNPRKRSPPAPRRSNANCPAGRTRSDDCASWERVAACVFRHGCGPDVRRDQTYRERNGGNVGNALNEK
jgi:hypothetical protein